MLTNFLLLGIAPLQKRSHPVWEYTGVNDATRLFTGENSALDREALDRVANELYGGTNGGVSLKAGVLPLYADPDNIDSVLAQMPLCNELGILPEWAPPGAFPLGGDDGGFRPTAPTAGENSTPGSSSQPGPNVSSVLSIKGWTLSRGPRR